jgi:transcriptional/translational regulatory protein YebC/TACO1
LRKTANLMSKVVVGNVFEKYANIVIKEMTHEQKKELLELIDEIFPQIDVQNPDNHYILETHENLQEIRRNLDSKVLFFNHQITLFPFNVYARILKMKKFHHYTHQ